MAISLDTYKNSHKSGDQKELERREAVLDKALDDFDHFTNQGLLKWENLPEGTQATPEEAQRIVGMFGMLGQANRDFRSQQRKMGLRPWEDGNKKSGLGK